MPDLYRIFPSLPSAAVDEPGGALYIPPQGGGRLDNSDLYSVFYASNEEPGAIAEAWGRFPEWTSDLLAGSPALPGSSRAVARYDLTDDAPVCNLDDPHRLVSLGLRPSDVVSRDYTRSREWARRIYEQGSWVGVSWWSYYNPQWTSFGLWNLEQLTLQHVRILRLNDPAVMLAAHAITRRIILG